jgi:hypothetical protein
MKATLKAVSLVVISVALTLSGSDVFAKTGGPNGASQAKSSGTSAAPSGSSAGGNQSQKHACKNGGTGSRCIVATPPPGATGGNDPNPNRGPGNPTLHPK